MVKQLILPLIFGLRKGILFTLYTHCSPTKVVESVNTNTMLRTVGEERVCIQNGGKSFDSELKVIGFIKECETL